MNKQNNTKKVERIFGEEGKDIEKDKHYHDFENPTRKGRAHYVCKGCGEDITLDLVYMAQLGE